MPWRASVLAHFMDGVVNGSIAEFLRPGRNFFLARTGFEFLDLVIQYNLNRDNLSPVLSEIFLSYLSCAISFSDISCMANSSIVLIFLQAV